MKHSDDMVIKEDSVQFLFEYLLFLSIQILSPLKQDQADAGGHRGGGRRGGC